MVIALLALVVAGIVVAGAVVVGARVSPATPLLAALGATGALVVLAVVVLGLIGSDSGSTRSPEPARPAEAPTSTAPAGPGSERVVAGQPRGIGPVVRLQAADRDADVFPFPTQAVDRLGSPDVLQVRADGFEPFARARVRHCVASSPPLCGNEIDVQFGEAGEASFQYLVVDDPVPGATAGGCRSREATCTIVVDSGESGDRAEIVTVFHDRAGPPPRLRVSPQARLADGQTVTARLSGVAPGTRVHASLCAAPDVHGPRRCDPPQPALVAPDGTATAGFVVRSGRVGTERASCGVGDRCAVTVTTEGGTLLTFAEPVAFAERSGARYETERLAVSLALLVLALGSATWLVRRTDWSPVGEAAAPEIDEAEYADLDAIVAFLPAEDEPVEAGGRR